VNRRLRYLDHEIQTKVSGSVEDFFASKRDKPKTLATLVRSSYPLDCGWHENVLDVVCMFGHQAPKGRNFAANGIMFSLSYIIRYVLASLKGSGSLLDVRDFTRESLPFNSNSKPGSQVLISMLLLEAGLLKRRQALVDWEERKTSRFAFLTILGLLLTGMISIGAHFDSACSSRLPDWAWLHSAGMMFLQNEKPSCSSSMAYEMFLSQSAILGLFRACHTLNTL
jgi:hypothetical protein